MSITSRITSMEEHISEAYDELQGLGADLTDVNKNIENISSVLDTIYDSMPQVSGEGTSVSLDNTRVGKIKSTLKGNTSQNGTPTPSSPIPVNVVSGDNTIVSTGKNLTNIDEYLGGSVGSQGQISAGDHITSFTNTNGVISFTTSATYRGAYSNYIEIKSSTGYVISFDKPTTGVTYFGFFNWYDENKTFIQRDSISTPNRTSPANAKYCIMFLGINETGSAVIKNIQLEVNSTATTYEPYVSSSYQVNLGDIELCKIGDYEDYFYKSEGNWYKYGMVGKRILKGTETYGYYDAYGGYRLTDNNFYLTTTPNEDVLCTHFKGNTVRGTSGDAPIMKCYNSTADSMYLFFCDGTSSVTTFKQWLSNNNVTLYYKASTPTTTPITYQPLIEQLNAIEKAMSYNGQTNISQVNNDLPFIISASALKEWQESNTSTLSMVNPLSLGNTLNTQENDIQSIEVDNIEPLEEGNYEENQESI